MYTKSSVLPIAIAAVLADRSTPGALAAGSQIDLTPDNPNLGTLERVDATNFRYTFTDFGTVNFHATATNSDGATIGSSKDASATSASEAAADLVISVTAAPPPAPAPAASTGSTAGTDAGSAAPPAAGT